jgi:hypothetical protein
MGPSEFVPTGNLLFAQIEFYFKTVSDKIYNLTVNTQYNAMPISNGS